jgi:hypothetical protein
MRLLMIADIEQLFDKYLLERVEVYCYNYPRFDGLGLVVGR